MTKAMLLAALLASGAVPAQPALAQPTAADDSIEAFPPLFSEEMELSRQFVDAMIRDGVVVPVPKDPGGGYTHEQHKRNYRAMYSAGHLFRITGREEYRNYVRDMLLDYASLYPTLGDHPAKANQNTGRLFWQVLNDTVWLVYAVQGYEAIRDTLTPQQRATIDDNVFRKAARFLSVDSEQTFNRIHNHATWATAGVGMTGYLLGDRDLVDIALLGSDKTGKAGFLRQTELLFSPDGYYAEGPYYQRYALLPFMVFADAIDRNDPARRIFAHRDGILLKALHTTIQLSYDGYFFPFNDALKEKGLRTDELYEGIAIAYAKTRDPALLSVADWQGRTVLTENGLQLARDLAAGKAEPFDYRSLLLRDGPDGDLGAVAIMRAGDGMTGQAVVAKNSSQGMGHGHFDKLSWQYYDNSSEIVTDYGAARFLNIVAKEGGRYLPENETWAKTTIAHNAPVVDETSHFGGDVKLADQFAPTQLAFIQSNNLQLSAGTIDSAYDGVSITRNLALAKLPGQDHSVVIDLTQISSDVPHKYDLPIHYDGQIMRVGFDVLSNIVARPLLGRDNGYQHVWVDATGAPKGAEAAFVTWLLGDRFYTARWIPQNGATAILGESGANDPDFNLRREPMLVQRLENARETSFVTVLETHGKFDGAAERTVQSDSQIALLEHDRQNAYDLITITMVDGSRTVLAISHDSDENVEHKAVIGSRSIAWRGYAELIPLDQAAR